MAGPGQLMVGDLAHAIDLFPHFLRIVGALAQHPVEHRQGCFQRMGEIAEGVPVSRLLIAFRLHHGIEGARERLKFIGVATADLGGIAGGHGQLCDHFIQWRREAGR